MKNQILCLLICMTALSTSGSDDRLCDPDEIHALPIAKRLETLGFSESTNRAGIYEKTDVELSQFLKWFNLPEKELQSIPNGTKGYWVKTTEIEGNRTVLRKKTVEEITSNTLVNVSINCRLLNTGRNEPTPIKHSKVFSNLRFEKL
ncbi:MAG: hypothetical protein A2283_19640 [Lentisphaerae bacterium RIFOXYA12_FULL_48_11]|nr:MAG: hypothetical protein A2283_19640 [Lentisphaerae bacterium RIFOXYA12_FULL_48_11]